MSAVRNCNQIGDTVSTLCSGLDSTCRILTCCHWAGGDTSIDYSILNCAIDTNAVGICMNAVLEMMQERTLKSVVLYVLEFRFE